jgi:Transmembrane secretion effector
MPEWARGRLNAVHMMSSQGGMALGAIGWGTLVTLTNIDLTLFAAALTLFPLSLFLRPLSIDFTENLNIEPSPLPNRTNTRKRVRDEHESLISEFMLNLL